MQYIYSGPPIAKVIDKWDCCGGMTFVFEKIKPAKKEKKRMFGRKNATIRELRALVSAKNATIACNNSMREFYRNATRTREIKIDELEKENAGLKEQLNDAHIEYSALYKSRNQWITEATVALGKNAELIIKAIALDEENKKLKKDIAELKAVNAKMMRAFPCSYGINSFDCFNCRCGGVKDDARG